MARYSNMVVFMSVIYSTKDQIVLKEKMVAAQIKKPLNLTIVDFKQGRDDNLQ